jgi:hypothetical protein
MGDFDCCAGPRTQASLMILPGRMINANQRLHWATKGEKTAALRLLGRWLGDQLDPADGRRLVVYTLGLLSRRRVDPANFHPSAKALTDGLVDAGVFPDDSDEYVQGPLITIGELSPEASKRPTHTRRVQVTCTLLEPREVAA